MRKETRRDLLCFVAAFAVLLFIWGHSAASSVVSGEESGGIAAWIRSTFGDGGLPGFVADNIRKLAHFGEYFVLGTIAAVFAGIAPERKHRRVAVCLIGAVTAFCDEGIQLFAEGRVASLSDVGIDCAGYYAALAIGSALFGLCRWYRRKKNVRSGS